ncbi:MAG: APC family permease [Betaproteobacteria bacterium]
MESPQLKRVLGLTDLVLFNVVVVFSVRGMTTAAKMGPVSILLWLLAVLAFFVPLGLTITELSTRDPGEGGFYRWSRDAFGGAHGFLGSWFYWVSNLTYLPSLLIFLASSTAFVIGRPQLGENATWVVSLSLGVLWFTAWLNVRGLEAGKLVTNGGAAASWAAALLLIAAGAIALVRFGSATPLSGQVLGASVGGKQALAYFGTLSFALVGLELAPIMGGEIREPARNIPRAILISGVTIAVLYIVGTVAVMVALPPSDVSPISGALGAAQAVANRIGWGTMGAVVAALITFSVVGGIAAWLGGVARLPLAIGLDSYLPPAMSRLHPRHGTPAFAIYFQTVLTSVFIVASQMGSSVREAYLVLLDATIIMNFVPFLYIFLALPKLRPQADEPGVVRVPGGRGTLWLVALSGFAITVVTLASAVIPPPDVGNALLFEGKLWGGLSVFAVVGYLIYHANRSPSS